MSKLNMKLIKFIIFIIFFKKLINSIDLFQVYIPKVRICKYLFRTFVIIHMNIFINL